MTTIVQGRRVQDPQRSGYQIRGQVKAMLCPEHRASALHGPAPIRVPSETGPREPGADQVTLWDLLGA